MIRSINQNIFFLNKINMIKNTNKNSATHQVPPDTHPHSRCSPAYRSLIFPFLWVLKLDGTFYSGLSSQALILGTCIQPTNLQNFLCKGAYRILRSRVAEPSIVDPDPNPDPQESGTFAGSVTRGFRIRIRVHIRKWM
jgi:hypothetical protein